MQQVLVVPHAHGAVEGGEDLPGVVVWPGDVEWLTIFAKLNLVDAVGDQVRVEEVFGHPEILVGREPKFPSLVYGTIHEVVGILKGGRGQLLRAPQLIQDFPALCFIQPHPIIGIFDAKAVRVYEEKRCRDFTTRL